MRSLEQLRAALAYRFIADLKAERIELDSNTCKKFGELLPNLPTMVRLNGLLATWQFLNAGEVGNVLEVLINRVNEAQLTARFPADDSDSCYRKWLNGEPSVVEFMRISAEFEAVAIWLKRAIEAYDRGET